MTFVISIAESAESIATIKKTALAVSNPLSTQYGHYLSSAQIADATAAAHEDIELVIGWLEANGVPSSSYTVRGSRVEVECTTGRAEALLKTKFAPLINEDTAQAPCVQKCHKFCTVNPITGSPPSGRLLPARRN